MTNVTGIQTALQQRALSQLRESRDALATAKRGRIAQIYAARALGIPNTVIGRELGISEVAVRGLINRSEAAQ